jgi:MFS family permease
VGWRAMFWLNVPVGIAAYVLAARYLPASPAPATRPRFDWAGTVLLAGALSAYCLAMTTGQSRGFGDPRTLALIAGAVLGLLAFVALQARIASPLVPLVLFRSLPFNASMAINLLVTTVMMSTLTLGPFYLSQGLHLKPQAVGGVMSIGPLIAALMALPAGRLVDRYGARRTLVGGLGLFTIGTLTMAGVAQHGGLAGYIVAIAVICAGYAFVQTPNNSATMDEAVAERRATVSSLLTLSRNLGLVSGAALIGSIFAAASGFAAHAGTNAPPVQPEAVAYGLLVSFLVDSVLSLACLALAVAAWRSLQGRRAPAGVEAAAPVRRILRT